MAIKDELPFGITANAAGLAFTESVSITHRVDKAETVGASGNIKSCSYYNHGGEWTCTGYKNGFTAPSIGSVVSALGSDANGDFAPGFTGAKGVTGGTATNAKVFVTEVTIEEAAEDFQKFTIKGNFYKAITTS